MGNCHWNRDTEFSVLNADFEIEDRRDLRAIMQPAALQPMIMLRARRE
jgi:hypothetical protein